MSLDQMMGNDLRQQVYGKGVTWTYSAAEYPEHSKLGINSDFLIELLEEASNHEPPS